MIDDFSASTGDKDGNGRIDIAKYADTISQFCTDRKPSQRWAQDLCFLTFEEEEEAVVLGNVGIKRQCQRCEQDLKALPGHVCAAHRLNADPKYLKARERGIAKKLDNCVHVSEAACQDCEHLPLFPNTGRPTKFRIQRLRPKHGHSTRPSRCNHFVAVSYCHSDFEQSASSPGLKEEDPYIVVEEDGVTERPIRAPRTVLDRAVDFCRQNGMRMIWIDQECIRQDNESEKNIAIQAMDIVYSKAFFSIALFQTGFKNQNDLDAFCNLSEGVFECSLLRPGRCKPPLPPSLTEQAFVDMLSRLSGNCWLTRSWTFQEAFASEGEMIILLPKPETESVSTCGRDVFCNDLSTSEVAIKFDVLDSVFKRAAMYFDKDLDKHTSWIHCQDLSKRGFAQLRETKILRRQEVRAKVQKDDEVKLPQDWPKALTLFGRLYPEVLISTNLPQIGGYVPTNFPLCNAAMALTFLANRHNSIPADRLAIIANLCGYQVRLNVAQIAKSDLPLSVCVLMLALMNGDLSLLCPESYNSDTRKKLLDVGSDTEESPSWLRMQIDDLKHLSRDIFPSDCYRSGQDDPSLYSLTNAGLVVPGCLWRLNTFLDLTEIQRRYRPGWRKLQVRRNKGSSIDADRLEEEYRLATTHVLFEILLTLKAAGEIHAADAIWQSTFNYQWQIRSNMFDNETVAEWPEKLQVYNRVGMFEVETNSSGDYNCAWLIDRVMKNGGVWIGSLVNGTGAAANNEIIQDSPASQLDDLAQDVLERIQTEHTTTKSSRTRSQKKSKTSKIVGITKDKGKSFEWDHDVKPSHREWQHLAANVQATLSNIISHSDTIGLDARTLPSTENLLKFAWTKLFAGTTRSQSNDLDNQRAVFDIDGAPDGTVLVFSPFKRSLETLPTPATRTHPISWVVETVGGRERPGEQGREGAATAGPGSQALRTGKMVRGMWTLQDIPGKQYTLV